MKQYVISYAYTGNTKVSLYENGVLINYVIVADYDISGSVVCSRRVMQKRLMC